jgi:hypothetical protein
MRAFLPTLLLLLLTATILLVGCVEVTYPKPSESYVAVNGFEMDIRWPGRSIDSDYSIGTPEWYFWYPYSVCLDDSGNLMVANIRGGFIERFDISTPESPVWLESWKWPRGRNSPTYPLHIAWEGSDLIVSESLDEGDSAEGHQVVRVSLPETSYGHDPIIKRGNINDRDNINDIFVQQYFHHEDAQPGGVDISPNGDIVFIDTDNCGIYSYSSSGDLLAFGGGEGEDSGFFRVPIGLSVDNDGRIIVADTWNHRVQIFSLIEDTDDDDDYTYPYRFKFEDAIGGLGNNNGELSAPYSTTTDAEGNIYVADTRNARVQKYDAEGKLLAIIYGEGHWRLRAPLDLVVTPDGDLWVIDAYIWYEPWDGEPLFPEDFARLILFRKN